MRTLVALGILIIVLFGALFAGVKLDPRSEDNPAGASFVPGLALDLEGGTQIILRPIATDGAKINDEAISQAIEVIRQRIDSSGVSEAEITSQGGRNIVVGIPGEASEETIDLVKTSAQMRFRPVLSIGAPQAVSQEATDGSTDTPTDPATETPTATPTDDASDPASEAPADGSGGGAGPVTATDAATDAQLNAATDDSTATPSPTPTDAATETPDASTTSPANPSDLAQITPEIQQQFDDLDCTLPENLVGGDSGPTDAPFVSCAQDGSAKYILGPVEIEGTEISNAGSGLGAGPNGVTTNEWVVNMEFNSKGTSEFAAVTERLTGLPSPQNQFAMVLDGLVISAPVSQVVISNGRAEISGTFTRESAATLANQLNFGALPLTFEVQSQEQISATLGSEQLEKGLIAGVIGLLLVVVYSLFQYRTLGLVTVASLLIAAIITFGLITLLSWVQGYRLSLPGVAGLIVAIGITADSFIVYFERIRDELRDGRTLSAAVEKGWARARRTILASDTVNFLAAIVLYLLAVGGVRGFAFTLGLTTIVDLVVVFLFTHPLMQLLSRTRFFAEGHPASGLDPRRLGVRGARYAGRGRVVRPEVPEGETVPADASANAETAAEVPSYGPDAQPAEARVRERVGGGATTDDGPRMTIAERRAAARRAEEGTSDDGPPDPPSAGQDGANPSENEEKL